MRKSYSSISISKPAIVFDLDDTLVYATPLKPDDLNNRRVFISNSSKRMFWLIRDAGISCRKPPPA